MLDLVEIGVSGGNGGDGAVSFRREKFVPLGGPDGGDGGIGGAVIVMADPDIGTLAAFVPRRLYRAGAGGNGRGKNKHGRKGKDLVLRVPVGTIVRRRVSNEGQEVIGDLEHAGEQVMVARGGKGGLGNTHFASATNQVPRIAQRGQAGEVKTITLELRLIADVGIVGYPNVGKSSLLAAASAAKPRIASYPFTTLEPVLGVAEAGHRQFVLAEVPGLIEGAHLGRGLGFEFLRHAMRTKVLIHLTDGTSVSPVEDMAQVNAELASFDPALAARAQIVAVNKVDLPEVQARLGELGEDFRQAGVKVSFISAATGEGVAELMAQAAKVLAEVEAKAQAGRIAPQKTFRPEPRGATPPRVQRKDDVFVINYPEVERIVAMADMTDAEVRRQVRGELNRLGIARALTGAGAKPGDKVRCGEFEWEW